MARPRVLRSVLLLAVLSAGCAVSVGPVRVPRLCADRLPPKLILSTECPDGICGYTCEPRRWPPGPPPAPRNK